MSDNILKIININKTYKDKKILDGLNMTIKRGQIYGLIGENGAGKTTCMRIITGLSIADSGQLQLFDKHEPKGLEMARTRIGAIIENPALNEGLTAYDNLNYERIQRGIPETSCINKVLNMVELDNNKKKVKNYSLGMKQRLAIAMSLLSNPEFLILDEPINGLDPIWVIKIRELLKKLNKEHGVTILISSHILSELHEVANHFGILHNGNIIQELSINELNQDCKTYLLLKVDNAAKAIVTLTENLDIKDYEILPDNIIHIYDYNDKSGEITALLCKKNITVYQVTPMGSSLESYYTRMIGGITDV